MYGNESKERKPVRDFVTQIKFLSEEYNVNLIEMIEKIENIISGISTHASGIYIFKNGYIEQNSLMITPRGDYVTAWNMEDSDYCGGLKYDSLTTECQDKLEVTIELLLQYKKIKSQGNIRATYNKYLHPDVLNYTNPDMWDECCRGEIIDLFQFQTEQGAKVIEAIQPHNLHELSNANSLMRIVSKDSEQPVDKFLRYKANPELWDKELADYGITDEKAIKALHETLDHCYGVANTQEDIMELLMRPEISGFTLRQSDGARKVVGKKLTEKIPELKEEFYSQCTSPELANYVWEQCLMPQLSYSFSRNHVMPYSVEALQEMNLYHFYPHCYWNCATLNVNAASEDNDTISYGKIAKAIYRSKAFGVDVLPPSINNSDISFTPFEKENQILFGLGGISGIGIDVAQEIIEGRPYKSFKQFLQFTQSKGVNTTVKISKMIKLIKAGCFDEFTKDREKLIYDYIATIVPQKESLTLANLNTCISLGIECNYQIEYKMYLARKEILSKKYYIKTDSVKKTKKYYQVPKGELAYIFEVYYLPNLKEEQDYYWDDDGLIISNQGIDKVFNDRKEVLIKWLNKPSVKKEYYQKIFEQEYKRRVGEVNATKWSFETTSFYHYSRHELENIDREFYDIKRFKDLPSEPTFELKKYNNRSWHQYHLSLICGTVVDKQDSKHIVNLLTPEHEVINVKMNAGQYSWYKQTITENIDGEQVVTDPSWFKRGELLIICGFRNNDEFRMRRYKNSVYQHSIGRIKSIDSNGRCVVQYGRQGEDG